MHRVSQWLGWIKILHPDRRAVAEVATLADERSPIVSTCRATIRLVICAD
jgi:hypothetical protein